MDRVCIIVPTGERPETFKLCEKYLQRQTFKNFDLLIIDDGENETEVNIPAQVIRPHIKWKPGDNTQRRNISLALDYIEHSGKKYEFLGFMEDDDWYSPTYLQNLMLQRDSFDLIGESNVYFYLFRQQKWRPMQNKNHASLCQTIFRSTLLPIFKEAVKSDKKYIDIEFWRLAKARNIKWFHYEESKHCVGIKELPGRKNIGTQENNTYFNDWREDVNFSKLRELIGEEDCKAYREMFKEDKK